MSVYVISDTVPQDPQAWETYISLAPATIEKYGGRYLVRGGSIDSIEGSRQGPAPEHDLRPGSDGGSY